MKKLVLGISSVAVLAVVVGPFITANIAEQELVKIVERINADPQTTITIESYNKGFATADAQLSVQMNAGGLINADQPFTVPLHIEHGPILFSDFSFGLSSMTLSLPSKSVGLEAITSAENIASYKATLGFTNRLKHTIIVAPITIDDQSKLSSQGVEAHFNSDAQLSDVSGVVEVAEITLSYLDPASGAESGAKIEASTLTLDWSEVGHGDLMQGSSEWVLPQVSLSSSMLNATLQNISFKTESVVTDSTLAMKQAFSIKSITGPMKFDNLLYQFDVSNIQFETYDAFMALTDAVQAMPQDQMELEDEVLKELVRPIFQAGIRNEQHFSVDLEGGKIIADFEAEFVGDNSTADALFSQDDEKVLSSIEANLSASADSKAIMTTPLALLVPGWAQQGLVSFNGEKFEFQAVIKDAVLDLNGQSMPLAEFFAE